MTALLLFVFAIPLAVMIWFAGCFAYGGIMGVVAAFRYSFRKAR